MTDEETIHVHAIAEAVVDLLADRGLAVYAGRSPSVRVLTVREVARLLGRSAPWVYENPTEFGTIRIGTGPMAGIAFDLAAIENASATELAPPETRKARPEPVSDHDAKSAILILRP